MPKIFMSYSRRDGEYADKLYRALDRLQISGFLDQADIAAGASWDQSIKQAIREADAVVVLLSKNSVSSNYVMAELGAAWSLNKRIIPVVPPNASMSPAEVPPILRDVRILDARERTLEETADEIARAVQQE